MSCNHCFREASPVDCPVPFPCHSYGANILKPHRILFSGLIYDYNDTHPPMGFRHEMNTINDEQHGTRFHIVTSPPTYLNDSYHLANTSKLIYVKH